MLAPPDRTAPRSMSYDGRTPVPDPRGATELDEPALLGRLAELRPVDGTATSWVKDTRDAGLLDLPLPGAGRTARRFAALTALGRTDLDLARLAEGHADAHAVLAELGGGTVEPAPGELWGIWAANPPGDPVRATWAEGSWTLSGSKPWCSGAGTCDRALVTAHADDGYRLFAVDLRAARTTTAVPQPGTWPAIGMRGSDSRTVRFDRHPAEPVGEPGAYLDRPGFWVGAAGVAAVWLGGARALAAALPAANGRRPLHAHATVHAGAVDAALAAATALREATAHAVDRGSGDVPGSGPELAARRFRAVAEATVADVLDRVGRATGAAPLALDPAHAQRVADLQLYVRQSHAEQDLEQLGRLALDGWPW